MLKNSIIFQGKVDDVKKEITQSHKVIRQ